MGMMPIRFDQSGWRGCLDKGAVAPLCAALLLGVALTVGPARLSAEEDSGAQLASPQVTSINPIAQKKQLLANLYEQLEAAESKESADLIAETIEKLWLNSGSATIDLLMQRAQKAIEDEDLQMALKLLSAIVTLEPDYFEGWNRRAMVHFLRKEYEDSLGDLRQVLTLEPRHFRAINGLGLILQQLGDKKAALKVFRKVLEVYPHFDSAQQAERELSREVEGQGI
jgi:tetratricopeptide (TPR) repeat protein